MLFGISIVAATCVLLSLYLLIGLGFGLVLLLDKHTQGRLKVPLWFGLFGLVAYSPMILAFKLFESRAIIGLLAAKKWKQAFGAKEQSPQLHSEEAGRETGSGT